MGFKRLDKDIMERCVLEVIDSLDDNKTYPKKDIYDALVLLYSNYARTNQLKPYNAHGRVFRPSDRSRVAQFVRENTLNKLGWKTYRKKYRTFSQNGKPQDKQISKIKRIKNE